MDRNLGFSAAFPTPLALAGSASPFFIRRYGLADDQHAAHAHDLDDGRRRLLQSRRSRDMGFDPGNMALGLDRPGCLTPHRPISLDPARKARALSQRRAGAALRGGWPCLVCDDRRRRLPLCPVPRSDRGAARRRARHGLHRRDCGAQFSDPACRLSPTRACERSLFAGDRSQLPRLGAHPCDRGNRCHHRHDHADGTPV